MQPHISSRTCFLIAFSVLNFAIFQINGQTNAPKKSKWVSLNARGKLIYKSLPSGDKIMDFSYAGYMGGGVSIPEIAIKKTVSPVEGDNSNAIQAAIEEVSQLPIANGFRGTVLLRPGIYNCERPIEITTSGIVLRGSGSGTNGSVINMTGKSHTCITVRGTVTTKAIGSPVTISDRYVPSGAISFNVVDAGGFTSGDTIQIIRSVTDSWTKLMGMDKLVRDGKKQTWLSGEIVATYIIRRVEGNKIILTVPLTDNYDSKYVNPPGVKIVKISTAGQLSQTGIENLRIVSPAKSVTINEGHNRAFTMSGIADGWARNIEVLNTVNSVSITGRRITVDNLSIVHELPTVGAAKPADLNGSGQQLLFNRCYIKGDNLFFFGTGAKVTGPVVLLNCIFRGNGWIQPHQRWATGLLVDGCQVPEGGIDFMNRGAMGSGHGWAIGWAVAWNSTAMSFLNQQPPGSANWVIGGMGDQSKKAIPFEKEPFLPEGIYDSHGTPVAPASLYLEQLKERLGKNAVIPDTSRPAP